MATNQEDPRVASHRFPLLTVVVEHAETLAEAEATATQWMEENALDGDYELDDWTQDTVTPTTWHFHYVVK